MDPCICGRDLVCIKCKEIPSGCKCEKDVTGTEHDYSLVEAHAMKQVTAQNTGHYYSMTETRQRPK